MKRVNPLLPGHQEYYEQQDQKGPCRVKHCFRSSGHVSRLAPVPQHVTPGNALVTPVVIIPVVSQGQHRQDDKENGEEKQKRRNGNAFILSINGHA